MIFVLMVFGLILFFVFYKKSIKKQHLVIGFLWLVFTFLGTQGNALPVKLFPHRFWVFLTIPVAFFSAEAFFIILHSLKDRKIQTAVLASPSRQPVM